MKKFLITFLLISILLIGGCKTKDTFDLKFQPLNSITEIENVKYVTITKPHPSFKWTITVIIHTEFGNIELVGIDHNLQKAADQVVEQYDKYCLLKSSSNTLKEILKEEDK